MVVGLASMIGAGVFFVWSPAAAVAGEGLVIGLVIAAVIATLNALSSAQLAMAYPVSGGAYAYGRATIGDRTGFAAGALFLAGKTASVAAVALIAAGYLWPEQPRVIAVALIVVFAIVNMTGIRSTSTASGVIVAIVLAGLAAIVVLAVAGAPATQPFTPDADAGWYGILQSAGLLFFAFAGYARMATLGEEVVNPRRTLPRAILGALAITLIVYATVGILCVALLGTEVLAATSSPLSALVPPAGEPFVALIAAIACLGSLVGILAALSRTSLAMARASDLPGVLARISPRTHAPIVAEAVAAGVAILAVVFVDPARLVGFSSCAVLGYYAIAHAAALRQPIAERWLPRWVQLVGAVGCMLLALTLPWQAIVGAASLLVVAFIARRGAAGRR